ncbi:uncharacterized protein LOC117168064 [Belonocnema kinseyi]|uniref:uncharacterized protein LOC117168064 n=1 Tax=Belonocnema kinseyi TaxID=2817044 RepID=UPI00143CD38E|nr:uncharacterized protein LOC117168064 [Belonocnema kinseyi]
MKILISTLFYTLGISLGFIELSSQSVQSLHQPIRFPDIRFFQNEHGELQVLHGNFRPVLVGQYMIGVLQNDVLRPIYDHQRQMVIVYIDNIYMINVRLTQDHVRLIPYGHSLSHSQIYAASFTYHFM